MASLGTLTGTFLVPGVSRNGRLYRKDLIADSVADMSSRLDAGKPIPMMSCHDTTSTVEQVAGIRRVWTDEDGHARYEAEIPDTRAGRDLKALTDADPVTGERYLNSVSIYGGWVGGTRQVEHEGQQVVTGDKLLITRVDFVDDPGVDAARLDTQRATSPGEAALLEALGSDFVPLSEAAPPATFHDAATEPATEAAPESAGEASSSSGGGSDGGTYVKPKNRGSGTDGGDWADPGYQSDGMQRYDLRSASKVRSAWSYINQSDNASKYTAAQLAMVKNRIKKAANKFDIDISHESAVPLPAELGEAAERLLESLAAYEAMISISAYQGPADVDIRAFGIDNADVKAAAGVIGAAAAAALQTLDPDGDGDLDVPGGDAEDGDEPSDVLCATCLVAVPSAATYCPTCGERLAEATDPATPDQEVTEMAGTETTEASAGTCPSCKANVSKDSKFCHMCGANTAKGGGSESTAAPEAPATENASTTPDFASQIAAGMGAAFEKYGFKPGGADAATTESAPAAPATEAAPAAAPATETAPEKGVSEQIETALATERQSFAETLEANNKQLVAGIGEAMAKGFSSMRDELRAEIGEAGGHQRTGTVGLSREDRVRAAEAAGQVDNTPWATLPAHEREKRHQQGMADMMALSGIYSDGMVESVRSQNRYGG